MNEVDSGLLGLSADPAEVNEVFMAKGKPMDFNMVEVISSNLQAVGHNEEAEILRVQFKGGGALWDYPGVSRSEYQRLLNAPSVGKFFNEHIKNKKVGSKVQ